MVKNILKLKSLTAALLIFSLIVGTVVTAKADDTLSIIPDDGPASDEIQETDICIDEYADNDISFDEYTDNDICSDEYADDEIIELGLQNWVRIDLYEGRLAQTYSYTPSESGTYRLYIKEFAIGQVLSVYDKDNNNVAYRYSKLIDTADSASGYCCYETELTKAETYFFKLSTPEDFAPFSNQLKLTHYVNTHFSAKAANRKTTFIAQPGAACTLTVEAQSDVPEKITYQWFFENEPIEGAADAVYTIGKVKRTGVYKCLVSNGYATERIVRFRVFAQNNLMIENYDEWRSVP